MSGLSREQSREIIVNEAIKIIHADGYQSFSIRELAKQVKISEPAIYCNFLNKEDIILGILNRMLDFDHLLEKELLTKKSTQNKVRQFIQFHFDYLEKNHEMTSILFSEDIFDHSDVLRNRFLFIIKKRRNKLNSILQKAKTNSEIVDADMQELLTLIFGMIRMIVLEWRLSNFSFLLSQRGKNAINTLDELIFKN